MVDFLTRRDLSETKVVHHAPRALAAGEVELRVDQFALTANNVTYAAIGEVFGYWRFFPTDEEGWGRIPVWGFGTVTRSEHPDVQLGERFYGYFPMSSDVVLRPEGLSKRGFSDGAEHRRGLPAIYNDYRRVGAPSDDDAFETLLRPLFATAFLLDDFLDDRAFFGAGTVLLSSASSKTAYGTAQLLANRRTRGQSLEVVGLTSSRNVRFVERLGSYDRIVTYDAIDALPRVDAVFVDIAGDAAVRERVHRHYGDHLKHSTALGRTHWNAERVARDLPGPESTLFFAPERMKQRLADWGPQGLQERAAASWTQLLKIVHPSRGLLRIVKSSGEDAVARVFAALLVGTIAADEGHVLTLHA